VTATWEQSAAPAGIDANATKEQGTVEAVPVGATVSVWNAADDKIAEATNPGPAGQNVTIYIPGLAKDQKIAVRTTEVRKLISDPETVTAYYEKSAPPLPENIVTNATRDRVTVQGVPVDAEVKVYNDNDVMIGSGSYTAADPGVVVISTLPYD